MFSLKKLAKEKAYRGWFGKVEITKTGWSEGLAAILTAELCNPGEEKKPPQTAHLTIVLRRYFDEHETIALKIREWVNGEVYLEYTGSMFGGGSDLSMAFNRAVSMDETKWGGYIYAIAETPEFKDALRHVAGKKKERWIMIRRPSPEEDLPTWF